MELSKLIPLKSIPSVGCEWVIKGNFLMYRRYEHIPVAYINNDTVYIFLENKIPNQILKLTKWIINLGVEFYFSDPEFSNPYGMVDYHKETIHHYLYSYSKKHFFYGFRKINFDLIKNMVDWCDKENCSYLIKDVYQDVNKIVQRKDYDYYRKDYNHINPVEIREDFKTLYRDIQINKII